MNSEQKSGNGTGAPDIKGNQPPNPQAARQATNDNDLTTGHSRPGDGGDDNAKEKKDLDT